MDKLPWHPSDFDAKPEEVERMRKKIQRSNSTKTTRNGKSSNVFTSGHVPPADQCSCGVCVVDEGEYCCRTLLRSTHLHPPARAIRDHLLPMLTTPCITESERFRSTFLNEVVVRACAAMNNFYGNNAERAELISNRYVKNCI